MESQSTTDNESVSSHTCNEANCCTCREPDFPHEKLAILDGKVSIPKKWVVPVLPEQELESLMIAAINLCRTGDDVRSEACQRFFREGLTISFTKILTAEAGNSWTYNIHHCIYQNCLRLVELCVVKLSQDCFPLLDLLSMVFNPNNSFYTFNANRPSESVPQGSQIIEEVFARPPDSQKAPRGWLVDLINRFGQLGGFQILVERFQSGVNVPVPVVHALIKPFGLCYELLTVHTIVKYLMPIVERVPQFFDNLVDEELKKEAKNESKNDAISSIIKSAKCLVSRVSGQEETIKQLEIFRLKIMLRLLQISSFNEKMNVLNEVNKVIAGVSSYPHRHCPNLDPDAEWLSPERMANWIKENGFLQIVLRDSLHQPQYVEKLETILRFVIKEKCLSLEDLDSLWAAQHGKHEAIVKNVHDLLAKLAWDFSPEQLDHLFKCFQSSWTCANKKQREKLLELIRRLAEDDKGGVMALKILACFVSTGMATIQPILVVHGGAGSVPDSRVEVKLIGVKKAAQVGHSILQKTGNVLDAIEAAIHIMEDDPAFNAGKGSVLNLAGEIEMEALITEGENMAAGSVTLVKNIAHPISLARLVMEKTPHTILGGDGVEEFIIKNGIPRVPEYNLTTQAAINALKEFQRRQDPEGPEPSVTEIGDNHPGGIGTVGCVAVDSSGHVASGTSTGGITGKYKGRIGDTPLPGCGGYSDDEIGAVSTTGHGESILKYNLAHRILTAMQYGESAQNATAAACEGMTKRVGKTAGAITVSKKGEVGISFTSKRMAWAYQINDEIHYGIDPGQHLIEKIN